ncbi:MAG: Gfo/Idh/MocA family oxidoreductase [Verrucomicrobiota bacterium]
MSSYRAGIVGLGQVGLMFDEDEKRDGVWTHFSAYEALGGKVDIVAVCDPDTGRCQQALDRKPGVHVYEALEDMLHQESLDMVSLCTPPSVHAEQIQACAGRVKAIICEKPLADQFDSAEAAVYSCQEMDTVLAVNYYKRFDGAVPAVKGLLEKGRIGTLTQVNAWYAGPFEAVGSHMIDLLRFFCGELSVQTVSEAGEDAYQAHLTSVEGVRINLSVTGKREDLIFECDLVGTEGRLRLLENCRDYEWYQFEPSARYSGYRELVRRETAGWQAPERFLPLFEEVIELLGGNQKELTSSGHSALETQRLMDDISKVWRNHE